MHDDSTSPEDADFGFMSDLGFAEGRDVSTRDERTWRVAALAAGTCIVAVAVAVALLHFGRGGTSNREVGLPILTGGPSSPALLSSPPDTPFDTAFATFTPAPLRATKHRSTSAAPSRTRTRAQAPATSASRTSARPSPLPSRTPSPTQPPPTTTTTLPPPPPPPSTSSVPHPGVTLSKGSREPFCGKRCYSLVVTLIDLPGTHQIVCHSSAGVFNSYTTSDTTSTGCSFGGHNTEVWVVVDNIYESNQVSW